MHRINKSGTVLGINDISTLCITLTVESAANDALHSAPRHLALKSVLFFGPSLTFAMHPYLLSHVHQSSLTPA